LAVAKSSRLKKIKNSISYIQNNIVASGVVEMPNINFPSYFSLIPKENNQQSTNRNPKKNPIFTKKHKTV